MGVSNSKPFKTGLLREYNPVMVIPSPHVHPDILTQPAKDALSRLTSGQDLDKSKGTSGNIPKPSETCGILGLEGSKRFPEGRDGLNAKGIHI